MFYFLYPPLHSTRIVFTLFGKLVNILYDHKSIQIGFSSKMVSTLALPFSGHDDIELGFSGNNLVINERQFVTMLHVINEVIIDA